MDQSESTPGPQRACSVRPDPIDLRDVPYRPGVASAPRLELFPLRLGRVKDQLHTNACTGYALSSVIELLLERAERESKPSISPFMLYSMARRFDELKGNEDLDLGSSVRGALKGWSRFGACAEALWSEASMPQATNEPGKDWWLEAVKRPLGAYYRVDPQNLGHMHMALTETSVLYASAAWHDGWESGRNAGTGKAAPSTFADVWEIPHAQAGARDYGHAVVIAGYHARGFLIQNSWGEQWGTGGFALLTYRDWLANGMDCWAVQLGVPTEDHLAISDAPSLRYEARTGVALASAPALAQREVSPFIVDMENNGELSSSGQFRTQDDDLRALVDNHLPQALKAWELANDQPIDVAVFAHWRHQQRERCLRARCSMDSQAIRSAHLSRVPDVGERHLLFAQGHHRRCNARRAALDGCRPARSSGTTGGAQILGYAHRAAGIAAGHADLGGNPRQRHGDRAARAKRRAS